jgi:hypothetical protein
MLYGNSCCTPVPDPGRAKRIANFFYTISLGVMAIFGFVLYNTGGVVLKDIINTKCTTKWALGITCVARTTAPLALWFLLHAFAGIGNLSLEDSCQFHFHVKCLPFHALALIALWVVFWFIPDAFYDVFMQASIYLSALYLLIQLLFLLDFFVVINDYLTQGESQTKPLILTIVLEVGSLVAYGLCFYIFLPEGCSTNAVYIGVNLAVSVILFVAAIEL